MAVYMKPIIIVIVSIVLGSVFHYFFAGSIEEGFGVAVPIYAAMLCGSLIVLTQVFKRKLVPDVIFLTLVVMFFSVMVVLRDNELLTFLNIVGTILLLMLMTQVQVRGSLKEFVPLDYFKVLVLPFRYLASAFDVVTSVRIPFMQSLDHKSKQIVRGVIITVPVIILFAALFAGADPVFRQIFESIAHIRFVSIEYPHVILIVTILAAGALGYSLLKEPTPEVADVPARRPMGHIETSILLGSVNVLFVLFIMLQATYLFGGVANIANDTFTFAEYARRGFFELIAIAAFSYLILLGVEKLIERNATHHSKAFKYLSAALVVQVMVLMFFAFNRLSLYEAAFGFTTLRLYSHAFIVLLGGVYLLLLYKILTGMKESAFALKIFFAVLTFVASMNLLNPDLFIAQKNLERFEATGKVDYDYLATLSADATPVLITIFEKSDPITRSPLGHDLYMRTADEPTSPVYWQAWNKSRAQQAELLKPLQPNLEPYRFYTAPELTVGLLK